MFRHDASFERGVVDVREGRVTFDVFARRQRAAWDAMAGYLMRRWRAGVWVDREDVVQDLLLGAWHAIFEWDPHHPSAPSLAGYVVYNALDKAKKRLHRYRGALLSGNADAHPSANEKLASQLWGDDATRRIEESATTPPEQEEAALEFEVARAAMVTSEKASERHAIEVARGLGEFRAFLVGDDFALTRCAEALYGDEVARRECRLRSSRQALRSVVLASQSVATRLIAA